MDYAKIATDLMSTLGYGGLAVGLILDSFGIPIPSEVLLPVGGALAATGRFNVWIVLALGTLAQLVGGLVGYAVGRFGGYPFLQKYGKYILVSHRDLDRTRLAFEKYGPWLTMGGRCMPVIRGLVGYPAGIARMRVGVFVMYTAIGSLAWSALFVWLGFILGENLGLVNKILHDFSIVVILVIVGLIGWHFRSHMHGAWRRYKKPSQSS